MLSAIAVLFFVSCNNSADEPAADNNVTDTLAFGQNSTDTLIIWNVDNEKNTKQKVDIETVAQPNVQAIINGINMVYPDVLLKFDKSSGDTLFVSIPQSEVLTQRMGSAGASQYFAVACINLFEVKEISYIYFDFKEGDHARPGIFNRQQFDNIKEVK